MRVFYNVGSDCFSSLSISEFTSKVNSKIFFDEAGLLTLYSESILDRLFISADSDCIYISDNLRAIIDKKDITTFNKEMLSFYEEFGFLLPPFTQYSDVFFVTPFRKFLISEDSITFVDVFPDFSSNTDLVSSIVDFFGSFGDAKFDILVSGGIDSSALLGLLNERGKINNAYMCQMSSLTEESLRAERMCNSIEIPFNLIDLEVDLSETASRFIDESGELISDSVSIVMLELFQNISKRNNGSPVYVIDGQGADSLLNGLPLNKVLHYWGKISKIRPILKVFSKIPIFKDKSSPLRRKLYRFTKALKCLSQSEFHKAIIIALSEVDDNISNCSHLSERLMTLYGHYNDWHFVLRFFYLFDILPAREMQKYLFSRKYNVIIVAPFLDEVTIKNLISMSNDKTIVDNIFKYPITALARLYWPDDFKTSSTSPFQVNYSLGDKNVKSLSLSKIMQ